MKYKGNLRALLRRFKDGNKSMYKNGNKFMYKDGDFRITFGGPNEVFKFQIWFQGQFEPIIWCTISTICMTTEGYSKEYVKFLKKCLNIVHEEFPEKDVMVDNKYIYEYCKHNEDYLADFMENIDKC